MNRGGRGDDRVKTSTLQEGHAGVTLK